MNWAVALGLVLLCLAAAPTHANNREYDYRSSAEGSADDFFKFEDDTTPAECRADPRCFAALRAQEARLQEAQSRWEKKSLDQKLEPYFWVVVAAASIWFYLGRKK